MSYTVTEATVVFPDKKAPSSFSTGYASKKPCAHIDCDLEGGFQRSIWIPTRVARLYVKNRPELPCDWDVFRESVELIERKCALTMVTEMLSRRDHATGEVRDKLACYGFRQPAIDFAVSRATEYRFLDENRFCAYFIEERKRRGWGQRKIETELKRRHVTLEDIPGYPEQYFAAEDDLERASALLSKRRVPETRGFEKLVRFLMGKGFSYHIAADAAKARIDAENEECSV